MAAVSILTSAAAFDKQCERVGLAADWIAAMKASGITTLGKLSYAVSLPGTQPTADEMDSFTATLRPGARVNLGDSSAMKQLIFEAQTMTVAELRATMQSGEDVSRKLPASERSMRIEDQKQRLKGLPLEGPLSVAHCVYDKLANMRENDELKYLSPGECITRDAELCCEKPPKALQLDANKMGIVVKDEEALATMSVDSDLQLYQAMMRRALAMDLVGLASYETVQKWNERLFRIMSQDPPPEFQKVSRAQVLRADRQCFLELARTCNGNLKPDARGVLPLDKEFEKLEYNQSVMYFLLPVKGKGKGSGKPGDKGNGKKRTSDTPGDGKNKKLKITRDPIPDALKGMHSRTPDNKPILCTGDLIAHADPEESEAPVQQQRQPSADGKFCSASAFCVEVFARRACLCGCLRMGLPNSFAVGKGCSQAAAAPVVPMDILSPGGLALCASWAREPSCAWVHIRCPRSIFPNRQKSPHPSCDNADRCVYAISQLLKHCNDTETPWTVEAASRSSFWTTDLGKSLINSSVDIDLSAFGSPTPGCIRFASSLPLVLRSCASLATASRQKSSTDVALGQLYRALASVMLEHLHVRAPQVPPLAAAQVATGMQPRKFPLAPVPEFKRFVQIAVPQCPPLDSKNRLLTTLRVQDTVVPAGSKLVPPFSRLAADRVEGEGLIRNQVHRTSQAGASLAEHNPDASDASSGLNQAAPPLCGSAGALPSSSGLVGAACDSVHPSCNADMPPRMLSVGRAAPSSCGSPAFPFSPSGVGGAAPLALSPTCSGSLVCATECEAEMLASNLGARVDASSLVSMFETLPAEVPARGVDDAREKAWTAGAYSQNKLCGLRKHTRAFPRVVSAAVRYLRTCFPDACFATIAFYSNVCTPMHRDANNLEGTLNYVAPLTSFKDGGIWVQDDEGTHSRMTPCGQSTGRVLQVCEGPVHFDAHRFHCTLPWLGSRIVLIGFTPRNLSSLKQSDTRLLLDLGFPLPGHNPPILPAIAAPQVDGADTPQVELAEERDRELCTLTFGVYHTESEFVRAAVKAGHPRAMVDSLPAHLDSCIDLVSKAPPSAIVERRKQWLDKWTARAAEIGVRPDPIWEVEDPHMREVLRSKRLQLLDEIIASEGYEDVSLASDIRSGFDLVGTSPVSNVLPGKVSPASLHPDDVSAAAGRANEALQMSLGSSGDHATDLKLWEKTMQEVDRGWLVGPYGWDDLPDGYVVSHRFPLWQHDKLRPIDDYSRSGVNACVTTLEQPTVDTADVAAAMFAKLCEGLGKAKRPSWIKGRSFDLTAAYRQLCVSTASRKFAVIAVYNPHTGKTCLFTQICLPFGSRASVNGFIRCSRCIQWLATRCLLVPTTSYYDDFIVASPDCLADNAGSTMELLFQLLGWVFDTVGPKADTFSRDVSALGLHFDLSESGGGVVIVDNTEKRKRDIHALVSDVLAKGQLSYKGGMELRGKLAFANSQVMGKAGHYALKHVSTHVHAYPFMPKLSAATTDALSFLMARILEGQPRRIHKPLGLPWFVYTDASFEPDYTGGLGGVLISPSGSVVGWFSLLLECADIRPLLPLKAETGIGELEAIAVVLAFQLWEEHLKSTECVAYLDNEGARCSLIKGCSSSWSITRICHIFAKTCESHTAQACSGRPLVFEFPEDKNDLTGGELEDFLEMYDSHSDSHDGKRRIVRINARENSSPDLSLPQGDRASFLFESYMASGGARGSDDPPPEVLQRGAEAISFTKGETIPGPVQSSLKGLHQNLGHASPNDMARPDTYVLPELTLQPASIPNLLEFNQVVALDAFTTYDAFDDKVELLMAVDLGTGFCLASELDGHSGKAMEATFCRMWSQTFGAPGTLVLDLETGLQAGLARFSEWHGTLLRPIAAQAHWQQGVVERCIRTWKEVWVRTVDDKTVTRKEAPLAITSVNSAMNTLRRQSGFSPSQAVWGRDPRLPEDLSDHQLSEHFHHVLSKDRVQAREHTLRVAAKESFFKVKNDEKLRRALLQRTRVSGSDLEIGMHVFMYRKPKDSKNWKWFGPATVIGREGGNYWASFAGRCHLIAPEHIRIATGEEIGAAFTLRATKEDLEKLLEVPFADEEIFAGDDGDQGDDDLALPPGDGDAMDDQEPEEEGTAFPPVAKRYRTKGPQDAEDDIFDELLVSTVGPKNKDLQTAYMMKLPKTPRAKENALEKEIPWSLIPEDQHEGFRAAERTQYDEHIQHDALEPLSVEESREILRTKHDRVLSSRFAYKDKFWSKRKEQPDIGWKHKARLVIAGHRDPDLMNGLNTHAPTVSRQGILLLLQILASNLHRGWTGHAGDVSAAFLCGENLLRELFLKQPRSGLGDLHPEQLLRIKKPIFGLVDSPAAWWGKFRKSLTSTRLHGEHGRVWVISNCSLDHCIFIVQEEITDGEGRRVLREPEAYMGVHVDDVLLVGDNDLCRLIQKELSAQFPIKEWESGSFEYVGSYIDIKEDMIMVSQASYTTTRLFEVEVHMQGTERRGPRQRSPEARQYVLDRCFVMAS
ncbi:RE2 [Symbiodinium sp. CCMP2592]|nr:RE2 [Symbiodinium sp. CCMP2592]